MAQETREVSEITIGIRHRKDLGDLDDLMKSITELDLLHPVVVTPDNKLVAGARRLEAWKRLNRGPVPVTVISDLDSARKLMEAERDENTCRMDMKVSEKVALGRALEEIERPAAKQRATGARWRRRDGSAKFAEPLVGMGNTRDRVGAAIGMAGYTYEQAKRVIELAESGSKIAQAEVEEMDRTGKVNPSYRRVIQKKPDGPGVGHRDTDKPFNMKGERGKQIANKAYERLSVIIGGVNGYNTALEKFDVAAALHGRERSEIEGFVRMLTDGIVALSKLRKRMNGELKHERTRTNPDA